MPTPKSPTYRFPSRSNASARGWSKPAVASVPLLRHVSGLNQLVAHDLVEFRKTNGPFQNRDQLRQVPGIGETRFTQAAGFLKINEGANPLDRTWIHPESCM